MVNVRSSTSEPDSSLQAPDGGSAKGEDRLRMETEGIPVDLAKHLLELEALKDLNQEEKQSVFALNLVLEEKYRQQSRLLEDKEEEILRLKEDAMSKSGMEGWMNEKYDRLNAKYRKLMEEFESAERKWKEEARKNKEEIWLLKVEKSKMEIDLQAARKGEAGSSDVVETRKAVEELKRLLEEKNVAFSQLVKEKMKIEQELHGRVVKLERLVAEWMGADSGKKVSAIAGMVSSVHGKEIKATQKTGGCCDAGLACSSKSKGIGDLQKGPKSVGTPLIQPKEEIVEADVQVKQNDRKELGCMVSGIKKEVTYAPKLTDSIVQISDDEEEEKEDKEKEEKQILPVRISSTAAWPRKRKYEAAVTCTPETEKQDETRLCRSNSHQEDKVWETAYKIPIALNNNGPQKGKLWETAEKMLNALNNSNLCLKAICALYRKHNSLGVWKNQCCEIKVPLSKRGMELGRLFTGGDPEGKMSKEASNLKRVDDDIIMECRNIARSHYKELFEIYYNDLDPLFEP